jgi:hypothetical protein
MQSVTAANLDWTTGTSSAFGLPGTLNQPNTLTIDPGGIKTFDANFTNQSIVTQNDNVAIGSGVTVSNSSNGIWNLAGAAQPNSGFFDPSTVDALPPATFSNSGILAKTAGTAISTITTPFTNAGTIRADTGTIEFFGPATFNAGTTFSGNGTVKVFGGLFNGGFNASNLELVDATGNGAIIQTGSSVSFAGDKTFPNQGGHQNGFLTGDWTVAQGATMNMGGPIGTNTLQGEGGKLTNNGTVQGSGGGFGFDTAAATIINNGTFTSNVTDHGGSTFVNNGTVRPSGPGASLGIGGNFQNTASGTVQVLGGSSVGFNTFSSDPSFSPFVNQGRLTGVGAISNFVDGAISSITNNGIVSPGVVGGATGTLNLNANLIQGKSGSINIRLVSPSAFDALNVTGTSALGGTLNLNLNFAPGQSSKFDILTAPSITSDFAQLVLAGNTNAAITHAIVNLSGGLQAYEVTIAPIPLPAAFLLMGSGLLGLVAVGRRRFGSVSTGA